MADMKRCARVAAAALCLLAAGAAPEPAPAPAPHAAAELRWKTLFEPCRAEARAFCPDVPHWQGSLSDCLGARERELSSRCREAWARASRRLEATRITLDFERDCGEEKSCAGMDVSNGLIVCIDFRKDEVSPACRAAYGKVLYSYRDGYKVPAAKAARPTPEAERLWRRLYTPCRSEAEAFCRDVARWQGSLVECLAAREPELSSACRPAWAEADRNYESGKSAEMAEFICRPEAGRLCPGMRPGKGVRDCLEAKKEELTKGCREALETAFKATPR